MKKIIIILIIASICIPVSSQNTDKKTEEFKVDGKTLVFYHPNTWLINAYFKEEECWQDSLAAGIKKMGFYKTSEAAYENLKNTTIIESQIAQFIPISALKESKNGIIGLRFLMQRDSIKSIEYHFPSSWLKYISAEDFSRLDKALKKNLIQHKRAGYDDVVYTRTNYTHTSKAILNNPMLAKDSVISREKVKGRTMVYSSCFVDPYTWISFAEDSLYTEKMKRIFYSPESRDIMDNSILYLNDSLFAKGIQKVFPEERRQRMKFSIDYFFITENGKIVSAFYKIENKNLSKITAEEISELDTYFRKNKAYPVAGKRQKSGIQDGFFYIK